MIAALYAFARPPRALDLVLIAFVADSLLCSIRTGRQPADAEAPQGPTWAGALVHGTLMAGVTAHRTAACMRPLTPDAVPLIGRAPGASNVLLATGHNCWGILWAPITGKIVAEMLVDGAASCVPDECLRACDPARFASGSAADAALADRGRGRQMRGVATGQQW